MPSQLSCCTLFLRSKLKSLHLKGGNYTAYRNYGVETTGSCLRGDQPHHDFFGLGEAKFNCLCCYCSVTKSYPTLCDPMDCSTPGFPVLHYLTEFAKLISFESMVPSNYFILCHPLLLLSSIFPRIRVFSNELALCIRWPKYWSLSFSFSISPSNEYSGLISFSIDRFDLLAVQGTLLCK